MSEYRLDINSTIQLGDYSSIQDYMKIVGNDDKVTIMMNDESVKEKNIVCNILQNDNFNIIEKGEQDNGKYYIKASKKG